MIENKIYVDVLRQNGKDGTNSFKLVVNWVSSHETLTGLENRVEVVEQSGDLEWIRVFGSFSNVQTIDVPHYSSASVIYESLQFGNDCPLLRVSLYESEGGDHVKTSTTHQDDIEEEGMPIYLI